MVGAAAGTSVGYPIGYGIEKTMLPYFRPWYTPYLVPVKNSNIEIYKINTDGYFAPAALGVTGGTFSQEAASQITNNKIESQK